MPLSWIPKPLCYADYGGDWDRFLADVYKIFDNDFKKSRPIYKSLPVSHDSRIEYGKEAGFWHIVQSEDSTAGTRVPDLRRCEHITWPKPIIENCKDGAVSVWETETKKPGYGRQTRIILWVKDYDYLVILRPRPKGPILITAYCVIHESHKEKLRKQRNEYLKQKTPRRAA